MGAAQTREEVGREVSAVNPADKRIAVIGAGTMGPGIAQSFAQNGYEVLLFDIKEEALGRALVVVRTNLGLFVEMGLLAESEMDSVLARIHPTLSLEEAAGRADLVVEAVTERKETKREVFAQLHTLCPEDAILASNTSALNIFEITPRPATTVIAHWFAPPHILPLVEVVKGPETANQTVETVVDLLRGIGKTPVVVRRFVGGFVINRLQRALGREIFFLLDNGYITAEELDLAVKASIAPRMMVLGVVQRYDFTGLDISAANLENPEFLDPPLDNHPRSLFDLVEAGHLGVKTGKGFFDYKGRSLTDVLRERDKELLRVLSAEC